MTHLPVEGELLAGKYRIERVIGRGGMGVVFAAWHLELDQYVALKFLLPELAERGDSAERFRREARAAAKIKTEHVARVLDVGNFDGAIPYMVMELLEGCDLAEELRERGPLPIAEAVDYLVEAMEAVAEAHALGIVHRDLKPENVFLARRPNGSRTVKVLDFGISKLMVIGSAQQRSLTQTSTIMGSPLYMSPEQMRTPRDVDARSDIWALGAILYELLGGRPPFIADSIPQLCALLVESTPLPVRQLRPEVPEELEQVVARCLSKSVDARWPTVRELARALLPFASFESQVDAARIGRMRGTTDAPMVGQGTLASASPATSPLPTGKPAELAGAAVPESALATLPAPAESGDPVMHPTQHTWGATRPPGREGKRWPWVAGAAILVVTVMLVLWGRIRAPSAVGASDAQKSASPAPPTLPATRAAVQPERSSRPTAVSAITNGATLHAPTEERSRRDGNQAIAAAPGEPAATPAGTTPAPSPKPSERAGPSDHARKNAAPAAPSPARAKPSTDVGLTDFGGRR